MRAFKPALVGGFVLSGLALGVIALLLFSSRQLFTPTVHAVVYFQGSVANLEVGAPVTFRGVRVGAVTDVSVSINMADLTARIPVYVDVNPERIFLRDSGHEKTATSFERLLGAGLRAQLTMQSLITGQLLVDLDLHPEAPGLSVPDDSGRPEIPSIPSQLQTIESEINELPLKQMTENANRALEAIRRLAETLPALIEPLAGSLNETAARAQTALADIDRLAVIGQRQLAGNGDALKQALTSSDQTLRDADTLMRSLNEMTAANAPLRDDLQSTMRDLAASAGALRGFTHEIERDPSALLNGGTHR